MKEYKMGRGEYLEERIPDLEGTIEEYFGPVAGTEELDGHELFLVADPENPVFERILAGPGSYPGKKDTLIVHFEERPAEEVIAEGHTDAAQDAIDVKNEFLYECTGRDAEARRDSMKRAVEDDPEAPGDV
ncbi:MAG: DUF5611 family protein [Halobacteriales archaeon]